MAVGVRLGIELKRSEGTPSTTPVRRNGTRRGGKQPKGRTPGAPRAVWGLPPRQLKPCRPRPQTVRPAMVAPAVCSAVMLHRQTYGQRGRREKARSRWLCRCGRFIDGRRNKQPAYRPEEAANAVARYKEKQCHGRRHGVQRACAARPQQATARERSGAGRQARSPRDSI